MQPAPLPLTLASLRAAYRERRLTPSQLAGVLRRRDRDLAVPGVWTHRLDEDELAPYLKRLEAAEPEALPLYGVPFAIKDNIDLAQVPTTAACPAAAYTPTRSAFVVQRLIDAGAMPVGKTNMDQFATGLVGTRSPPPWGPCANAFDRNFIAGGSSAGSAVAVALGLASFSLGTDTAGSGRVPAAFNNLVGLKPSRGLLSGGGVVPACRSLDAVSLFALLPEDAAVLFELARAPDPADPYARQLSDSVWPEVSSRPGFRIAVPQDSQLQWDDAAAPQLFEAAVKALESLGAHVAQADFGPFLAAGKLLYEGPWLAERALAVQRMLGDRTAALHPVVAEVIQGGRGFSAMAAFDAQHRLQDFRRQAAALFTDFDFALTPTTPGIHSIQAVLDEPLTLNARLGHYTNFMNLLDLAAVAVPGGFLPSSLPWGITLFGPAGSDRALLNLAQRHCDRCGLPLGATGASKPALPPLATPAGDWIELVVCGAHLSGCPLNHQLRERRGRLVAAQRTAPRYRLFRLPGGTPERPGLVRVNEDGAAIDVEAWALPAAALGTLMAGVPPPLAIGKVELADGRWRAGFVCEAGGTAGAADITAYGGWRQYLKARP